MRKYLYWAAVVTILAGGVWLRLYHIGFGLPHSFHADEPEIAELAIKYTYEFRDIIKNNNTYKLKPINFVYGSFPSYLYTATTMLFSKTANVLDIPFDKTSLHVSMRVVTAFVGILITIGGGYLGYKISKSKTIGLIALGLGAYNWKLLVHAHYVNADLVQTALILASFITICLYYNRKSDSLFTALTGILFGLAVGTKITTLITLPLYLYVFRSKKHFNALAGFTLCAFGAFLASNPFSFIFARDFAFRIYQMMALEGGLVFDSVDYSPFKYIFGLSYIVTPIILILFLLGIINKTMKDDDKTLDLFFIGNVLIYLFFFSLQPRRVDRWLLPIVPIVLMYASFAIEKLIIQKRGLSVVAFLGIAAITYLYFPYLLIKQFSRYTPKAEAYLWLRDNKKQTETVLAYTEEGLDPLNKLSLGSIHQVVAYEEQNAQYFVPEDPLLYDYVVLSSKPMSYYKKPIIREKYPLYAEKWANYEDTLNDPKKFVVVKEFSLPKPNLVELSDVVIYKRL